MLKKEYLKGKPLCKVTFTLPREAAQEAKVVKVLGDFNGWNWENGATMKAGKKEYSAVVELPTGRAYEFRYLIDNHTWANDWGADAYTPTQYGVDNSVVALEAVTEAPVGPAPAAKKTPAKKAATKKTAAKAPAARQMSKAGKDELTKIEGIGPKIEQLLNKKGITTYADLAKAKKATLSAILDEAGSRFKMHDPATWAEQAKLAEKGDWEKLAKIQNDLKGGKRK